MTPRGPGAPLALTALAYALCHHLGSLPDGLGNAGRETRAADWLDLLVPILVLAPALWTLMSAGAARAAYLGFAAGSWLYTTGHGIHLAANSVANAAPGEPAHLWDEYVGHWIWYAGVGVVAAAVVTTTLGRTTARHPIGWLLAVAVGATWATNATGGHFWVGGLVGAVLASAYGCRHRREGGALLLVVGLTALVVLPVSSLVA